MSRSLAERTLQTVDSAIKSGRVASMPELIRILRALSSDEGKVSVAELADLINQDQTVLMRVIAAANTFGYNPTNIEISTVHEAIHTIGFNRVRMLAMSLMLLDHAGRTTSDAQQRHLAAVSLTSGLIAQVAAEHAGLIDPDLAFVCASLRNFGRLLLGTFMGAEFSAAHASAEQGEGDEAYRRTFGLTPFELGHALLKSNQLPAPILLAVRQHEPPAGEAWSWSDRVLQKLCMFSLSFSEIALDSTLGDADFAQAQFELTRRAAREFPFLVDQVPHLLLDVEERLQRLSRAAGSAGLGRASVERLRRRAHRTPLKSHQIGLTAPNLTPLPEEPSAEPITVTTPPDLSLPAPPLPTFDAIEVPPAAPVAPASIAARALDTLRAQLESRAPSPQVLTLALQSAWDSLHPQNLLFCNLDHAGRTFRTLHGRGPLHDRLGDRVLFRRTDRNAFFLCHDRFVTLSIQDTRDARVWRHLPDWMQAPDSPRSCLAVPVHHQRQLQGILVIGWAESRPIPLPPEELNALQALFTAVAQRQAQSQLTCAAPS